MIKESIISKKLLILKLKSAIAWDMGMKNTVMALILPLLAIAHSAESASYNLRDPRDHGQWESFELYLGSESFFRALNSSNYKDMYLAIDYFPVDCSNPNMSIRITGSEVSATTKSLDLLKTEIRVDRREKQVGLSNVNIERGDTGIYLNLEIPNKRRLIQDMINGSVIRFKVATEKTPTYMEFGLRGSMAAINRSSASCYKSKQSPEDYF